MVDVNFRVLRIGRIEANGLVGCSAAQLVANLSSVVAAYAWQAVPQQGLYRAPEVQLAADGPALLTLFGSRWPVFSLLAWAQQLRLCDGPHSREWACDGAVEPVGARENSMRKHPDKSFWQAALELGHRVAEMREDVVWVNAARLVFEPAVTLAGMMRPAALSCPLGAATVISLHGLFNPWGGEHYADAPAFAGRVTEALNDRDVLVDDIINSPWPLPTVFWQLSLKVDHTEAAVLHAWAMVDAIRAFPPVRAKPVGACRLGVRGAAVVQVRGAQLPYFPAWVAMLRATGFAGTLVALLPEGETRACTDVARDRADESLLCFGGLSASLNHEGAAALLALLQMGYDSVLFFDFDTLILEHPVWAVSDMLCQLDQPRPSMLFDRPHTLPAGAPDHSAVRFLRGAAGTALANNFMLTSAANPFLRVFQSIAHMDYHPHQDMPFPWQFFASVDGFPHASSVITLGFFSRWLAGLYRGLRMGPAGQRRTELERLCRLRLLPHCAADRHGPSGTAVLAEAAPTASNETWSRLFAGLFQWRPGEIRRLRPRLFQIGPSSAGTTAIRDFFVRHGLRPVKSYHKDRHVVDWINQALQEHRPALHYVDSYDAYTDFLYPFYSRIPWCTEGCKERHENVTAKVRHYLEIVSALAKQYPYSKFVFNTRHDFQRWLAAQMYSCWRFLDKRTEFPKWLEHYQFCCGAGTGPLGRASCWEPGPSLRIIEADADTTHEEWAHKVCCQSLPTFRWIWRAMHEGVRVLFAREPERLLVFPIEGGAAPLSEFIGVPHRPGAWRKAHAA